MKTIALLCVLSLAPAAFAVPTANTAPAFNVSYDDISGKWNISVAAPGDPVDATLTLTQKGEVITGSMSSQHGGGNISKGSYKDKALKATIAAEIQGSAVEMSLDATIDGDKISGSLTAPGLGTFTFAGSKGK